MFFSERSQNSSLGVCTGTLLAQNTSCMHFIQWSKSLTYWRRLLLCVALYVPGAGSDSHSNTHRHTADLQKSDGSESAEARMSLVGLGGTQCLPPTSSVGSSIPTSVLCASRDSIGYSGFLLVFGPDPVSPPPCTPSSSDRLPGFLRGPVSEGLSFLPK